MTDPSSSRAAAWDRITITLPPESGEFRVLLEPLIDLLGLRPSAVDPCTWVRSDGAMLDIAPVPPRHAIPNREAKDLELDKMPPPDKETREWMNAPLGPATPNRVVGTTGLDQEAIWAAIGFAQGVKGTRNSDKLPRWVRQLEDLGRRMAQRP